MIGLETIAQIQVVNWVKQCTTIPVIHIGNERKCSPQYGAMLKRLGTRAGVSDLFFPRSNGKQHGLFLLCLKLAFVARKYFELLDSRQRRRRPLLR